MFGSAQSAARQACLTKAGKDLMHMMDVVSHNILLIQDDPQRAGAVRKAFLKSADRSFEVEWVRTCSAGLEQLARRGKQEKDKADGIAAVLVDLFLSDSDGIETFDRLFRAAPQIPILVLSASQNEEIAKLALRRGAHDYLLMGRFGRMLPKTLGSMLERAANVDVLFEANERAQVTLNSIGDAVVSTDVSGHVTYLNSVAESMTGWSQEEAVGHKLEEVFPIIDATTRAAVQIPMTLAMEQNKTCSLTPNCVLIRRDGAEAAIEDSAAPIHDRQGKVTGAVMVFHDVTKTRAMSARMSFLAQHDSLTALPNRILLKDRLIHTMALAHRHQQKMAVLYLDVDRFKHVNDSLGHAMGDLLLQSVAKRLVTCVRATDTVSRQGGDEFVVLLSDATNAQDAGITADKILIAVSKPHHIHQVDVNVTASIGIATYPADGTEAETLMKHADFALLHAKDSGRNNYQFFKPDMNVRALERQSLEGGLRHALERHEFALHYQPKINLETGAIVGAEALIRWHHPERGLVPPNQFIPVAEECGFIVPISRWVLREGCRQARAWQDAGFAPICIAINISAVELRDKDFVAEVRAILTETGLDPRYLELELTETFLMQDSNSTAAVLHALKELGVHLALDDFGTGYSSLSYLRRFPIDSLKIDRSFVRDLTTDDNDASIVSAVINMGKSLHMRVVAEGVETREQLQFLQEHSCPEGQGYFFSHPLDAAEFTQMLTMAVSEAAAA
ncbi:MAG TPA: EAL domain-containing protein [Steroidobacteraceae bacterium]|jgi:diguanylate cyclase (GGDEF)-like protein/PAS domain S-box-containing protein|nr:EAL domain-containing protein [Steroidobacteraceae bacterium]